MSTRIQLRHDSAAAWTSANPVLAAGEVGTEVDTFKVKVGNGSTAWTGLPYATGGSGGSVDTSSLEGVQFHDGTTGGGVRKVGYARIRWVNPAGTSYARPTNMLAGDIWEHDA